MKYTHLRATKAIALSLSIIFTSQTVAWSTPGTGVSALVPTTQQIAQDWKIPDSLGRIEKSYFSQSSDQPLIVHIRDSHANAEAQKNIENILAYLVRDKKVETVALEGAFRKLPIEKFRLFKDSKINEGAGEALMNRGLMTGAEVFGLSQPDHKVGFYGVDDINLYRQSVAIFRTLKSNEGLKKTLASYRAELEQKETAGLNPQLLELTRKRHQYEADHEKLSSYLKTLRQAAQTHLKQDLSSPEFQFELPSLSRFFTIEEKAGKVVPEKVTMDLEKLKKAFSFSDVIPGTLTKSRRPGIHQRLKTWIPDQVRDDSQVKEGLQHIDPKLSPEIFERWTAEHGMSARQFFEKLYAAALKSKINLYVFPDFLTFAGILILREELDAQTLQSDISAIEKRLEEKLAVSAKEKELLASDKQFSSLQTLLNLEMTRADYEKYKRDGSEIKTEPSLRHLTAMIHAAETFYELSEKRDRVFVEKMLALRDSSEIKTEPSLSHPIVLITGGFHTDGIETILKQKNISHLVITPRITEVKNDGLYEKVMLGTSMSSSGLTGGSSLSKADLSLSSKHVTPALATQARADIEALDLLTAASQRDALIAFLQEGVARLHQQGASSDEINALIRNAVRQHADILNNVLFNYNSATGELSATVSTTPVSSGRNLAPVEARSEVRQTPNHLAIKITLKTGGIIDWSSPDLVITEKAAQEALQGQAITEIKIGANDFSVQENQQPRFETIWSALTNGNDVVLQKEISARSELRLARDEKHLFVAIGGGPAIVKAMQMLLPTGKARFIVIDKYPFLGGKAAVGIPIDEEHQRKFKAGQMDDKRDPYKEPTIQELMEHPDVLFLPEVEAGKQIKWADLKQTGATILLGTGAQEAVSTLPKEAQNLKGVFNATNDYFLAYLWNHFVRQKGSVPFVKRDDKAPLNGMGMTFLPVMQLPQVGKEVLVIGGGNVSGDMLINLIRRAQRGEIILNKLALAYRGSRELMASLGPEYLKWIEENNHEYEEHVAAYSQWLNVKQLPAETLLDQENQSYQNFLNDQKRTHRVKVEILDRVTVKEVGSEENRVKSVTFQKHRLGKFEEKNERLISLQTSALGKNFSLINWQDKGASDFRMKKKLTVPELLERLKQEGAISEADHALALEQWNQEVKKVEAELNQKFARYPQKVREDRVARGMAAIQTIGYKFLTSPVTGNDGLHTETFDTIVEATGNRPGTIMEGFESTPQVAAMLNQDETTTRVSLDSGGDFMGVGQVVTRNGSLTATEGHVKSLSLPEYLRSLFDSGSSNAQKRISNELGDQIVQGVIRSLLPHFAEPFREQKNPQEYLDRYVKTGLQKTLQSAGLEDEFAQTLKNDSTLDQASVQALLNHINQPRIHLREVLARAATQADQVQENEVANILYQKMQALETTSIPDLPRNENSWHAFLESGGLAYDYVKQSLYRPEVAEAVQRVLRPWESGTYSAALSFVAQNPEEMVDYLLSFGEKEKLFSERTQEDLQRATMAFAISILRWVESLVPVPYNLPLFEKAVQAYEILEPYNNQIQNYGNKIKALKNRVQNSISRGNDWVKEVMDVSSADSVQFKNEKGDVLFSLGTRRDDKGITFHISGAEEGLKLVEGHNRAYLYPNETIEIQDKAGNKVALNRVTENQDGTIHVELSKPKKLTAQAGQVPDPGASAFQYQEETPRDASPVSQTPSEETETVTFDLDINALNDGAIRFGEGNQRFTATVRHLENGVFLLEVSSADAKENPVHILSGKNLEHLPKGTVLRFEHQDGSKIALVPLEQNSRGETYLQITKPGSVLVQKISARSEARLPARQVRSTNRRDFLKALGALAMAGVGSALNAAVLSPRSGAGVLRMHFYADRVKVETETKDEADKKGNLVLGGTGAPAFFFNVHEKNKKTTFTVNFQDTTDVSAYAFINLQFARITSQGSNRAFPKTMSFQFFDENDQPIGNVRRAQFRDPVTGASNAGVVHRFSLPRVANSRKFKKIKFFIEPSDLDQPGEGAFGINTITFESAPAHSVPAPAPAPKKPAASLLRSEVRLPARQVRKSIIPSEKRKQVDFAKTNGFSDMSDVEGYEVHPRLVPASSKKKKISAAQAVELMLDPRKGARAIKVQDYDQMSQLAAFLTGRLMSEATRPYSVGLATGGTTETLRKGIALAHLMKEAFGIQINTELIKAITTLDDYYWNKNVVRLTFLLSSYREEQLYMMLRNLFPSKTEDELQAMFISPKVLQDNIQEAAKKWRKELKIFEKEEYRLLFQMHGIGTSGHDAFNETIPTREKIKKWLRKSVQTDLWDEKTGLRIPDRVKQYNPKQPKKLVTRDRAVDILDVTGIQNISHLIAHGFHPFFLKFMGDNKITRVSELLDVLSRIPFDELNALYANQGQVQKGKEDLSLNKFQFKDNADFLEALQYLLNNYHITPQQALTQGVKGMLDRTSNGDTVNFFLVSSPHKEQAFLESWTKRPSNAATASWMHLSSNAVVIVAANAIHPDLDQDELFELELTSEEQAQWNKFTEKTVEENWRATQEGRRVTALKKLLESRQALGASAEKYEFLIQKVAQTFFDRKPAAEILEAMEDLEKQISRARKSSLQEAKKLIKEAHQKIQFWTFSHPKILREIAILGEAAEAQNLKHRVWQEYLDWKDVLEPAEARLPFLQKMLMFVINVAVTQSRLQELRNLSKVDQTALLKKLNSVGNDPDKAADFLRLLTAAISTARITASSRSEVRLPARQVRTQINVPERLEAAFKASQSEIQAAFRKLKNQQRKNLEAFYQEDGILRDKAALFRSSKFTLQEKLQLLHLLVLRAKHARASIIDIPSYIQPKKIKEEMNAVNEYLKKEDRGTIVETIEFNDKNTEALSVFMNKVAVFTGSGIGGQLFSITGSLSDTLTHVHGVRQKEELEPDILRSAAVLQALNTGITDEKLKHLRMPLDIQAVELQSIRDFVSRLQKFEKIIYVTSADNPAKSVLESFLGEAYKNKIIFVDNAAPESLRLIQQGLPQDHSKVALVVAASQNAFDSSIQDAYQYFKQKIQLNKDRAFFILPSENGGDNGASNGGDTSYLAKAPSLSSVFPELAAIEPSHRLHQPRFEDRWNLYSPAGLVALELAGLSAEEFVAGGAAYLNDQLNNSNHQEHVLQNAAFLLPMLAKILYEKKISKREISIVTHSEALLPFFQHAAMFWLNPALQGTTISIIGTSSPRKNHYDLQAEQKGEARGLAFDVTPTEHEHPIKIGSEANTLFSGILFAQLKNAIRRGRNRALETGKRPTATQYIPKINVRSFGYLAAQYQMMSAVFAGTFKSHKGQGYENFPKAQTSAMARFEELLKAELTGHRSELRRESVLGDMSIAGAKFNVDAAFNQKGIREKFLNLIPSLLSVIKTIRKELKKEGAHDFMNSPKDSLEKLTYYRKRAEQIMAANQSAGIEEAQTLIVVGIGGSSVGAKSILEAVKNSSEMDPSRKHPRVIFLEGLDPDVIHRQMKGVSLAQSRILYISKSGETNEPNANFNSLKDADSLHAMGVTDVLTPTEFAKRVTVVTDLGTGRLYQEALSRGYNIFPHPLKIGGRFTLFSSVGILTLVMAGVNVEPLLKGAADQASSMLGLDDKEISAVEKPLSEALNQFKSAKQTIGELEPIVTQINREGIVAVVSTYQAQLKDLKTKLKNLKSGQFNEEKKLNKQIKFIHDYFGSNFEDIKADNAEALGALSQRLSEKLSQSRQSLAEAERKLPELQRKAVELLKKAPGVLMGATRFLLNEGDITKKKQVSAESRTFTRHITLILSEGLFNLVEWIRQLRNESLGKSGMDIFSIAYQGLGSILMNLHRFLEKGQIYTLVHQKTTPQDAAEAKLAKTQSAKISALSRLFQDPQYNVPIAAEVELEEGLQALGSYQMAEMVATMVEAKIQPSGKVDYSVEPGVKEQKRQSSRERQASQLAEKARKEGKEPEDKIIDIRATAPHVAHNVEGVLQHFIEKAAPGLEDEIAFGNYGDPLLRYKNARNIILEALRKNPDIHSIWFRDEDAPVVINPAGTLMLAVTPLENSEAIEKRDVSVGPLLGIYSVQKDAAGNVVTGAKAYNRQNLEASMILLHGPTGGVKSFFGSIREDIGGKKASTVYDFAKDPKGYWHPVESPKRSDILPIIEIGYNGRTSGISGKNNMWPKSFQTFYEKWIKLAPKNRYSGSVADPYEILLNNGLMTESMTPIEAQLIGAIFEDSSGNGRSLVMTPQGSKRATEVSMEDYKHPFTTSQQVPAYFGSQENLELLESEFILPTSEGILNQIEQAVQAVTSMHQPDPTVVTSLYMFLQKSRQYAPENIDAHLTSLQALLPKPADLIGAVRTVIAQNPGASSAELVSKLDQGDGAFVARFRHLGHEASYQEIDANPDFRNLGNPILENRILFLLREAYTQTSVGELIKNLEHTGENISQALQSLVSQLKSHYQDNAPTLNNVGWKTPKPAPKTGGVSLRKPTKDSIALENKIAADFIAHKARLNPPEFQKAQKEFDQLATILHSFSSIIAQNRHLFLDPEAGEYLSTANETDDETAAMDEALHDLLMGVNAKLGVKYEKGVYPLMQLCNRLISEENAEAKGTPAVRDGAIWHNDMVDAGQFPENEMPEAFKTGGKRDLLYDIEIDPLDGSSKMATKGTVGALLSVYKKGTRELVASVYVTFGPQIHMTVVTQYQEGPVAYQFALTKEGRTKSSDPEFILVDKTRTLPPAGLRNGIGLAFGGNRTKWDPKIFQLMGRHIELTMNGYASYSGSYAADATSLTTTDLLDYEEMGGGVYLYVAEDGSTKVGRLRPHETRPIGKIFEMMDGYASTGYVNILDVDPEAPQDIDSIIVGSKDVVKEFEDLALRDAYEKIKAKGLERLLNAKDNPEALYQIALNLAEQAVWKGANLRLHPEEYDAIAKRAVQLFLGEQKVEEQKKIDADFMVKFIALNKTARYEDGNFAIDVPLRIKNAHQARLWNRENPELSESVWSELQEQITRGAIQASVEVDDQGNISRVKLFDNLALVGDPQSDIYQKWIAQSKRSEVRQQEKLAVDTREGHTAFVTTQDGVHIPTKIAFIKKAGSQGQLWLELEGKSELLAKKNSSETHSLVYVVHFGIRHSARLTVNVEHSPAVKGKGEEKMKVASWQITGDQAYLHEAKKEFGLWANSISHWVQEEIVPQAKQDTTSHITRVWLPVGEQSKILLGAGVELKAAIVVENEAVLNLQWSGLNGIHFSPGVNEAVGKLPLVTQPQTVELSGTGDNTAFTIEFGKNGSTHHLVIRPARYQDERVLLEIDSRNPVAVSTGTEGQAFRNWITTKPELQFSVQNDKPGFVRLTDRSADAWKELSKTVPSDQLANLGFSYELRKQVVIDGHVAVTAGASEIFLYSPALYEQLRATSRSELREELDFETAEGKTPKGVILTEQDYEAYKNQFDFRDLPRNSRIVVLTDGAISADRYIPYLMQALRASELGNHIQVISLDTIKVRGVNGLYQELAKSEKPLIFVAPHHHQASQDFIKEVANRSNQKVNVLYHENYHAMKDRLIPSDTPNLSVGSEDIQFMRYVLGAHQSQLPHEGFPNRSHYHDSSEETSEAAASLARFLGIQSEDDQGKKYANDFVVSKITESGEEIFDASARYQLVTDVKTVVQQGFKPLYILPEMQMIVSSPHPDDLEIVAPFIVRAALKARAFVLNLIHSTGKNGVDVRDPLYRELLEAQFGFNGGILQQTMRTKEAEEAARRFREDADTDQDAMKVINLKFDTYPAEQRDALIRAQLEPLIKEQKGGKFKNYPFVVSLPHPKDNHPTHVETTKRDVEVLKALAKENGISIQLVYYFAPWAGDFNTYYHVPDSEPVRAGNFENFDLANANKKMTDGLGYLTRELAATMRTTGNTMGASGSQTWQIFGKRVERVKRTVVAPQVAVQSRSELREAMKLETDPRFVAAEVAKSMAFGFFALGARAATAISAASLAQASSAQGLSVLEAQIPNDMVAAAEYFFHLKQALKQNSGLRLMLVFQGNPDAAKNVQTFVRSSFPKALGSRLHVVNVQNPVALAHEIQAQVSRQGLFGKGQTLAQAYSRVTLSGNASFLSAIQFQPVMKIQTEAGEETVPSIYASASLATRSPSDTLALTAAKLDQLALDALSRVLSIQKDFGLSQSIAERLHEIFAQESVRVSA